MPVLELDGLRIPYRVVRTRRTRRMNLRVGQAGVTVTVPARCPEREIRRFLTGEAAWIAWAWRGVLETSPAPLADGAEVPFLDERLRVVTGGSRPRRDGDRLLVPAGVRAEDAVASWMRRRARPHFEDRVGHWAPRIGVSPGRLRVGAQRSRWGSASSRGTISLNWRLMLTPSRVVEYVVVHELCHLRQPDHSPAFWATVAEHLPDHPRERRWLADHGAHVLSMLRGTEVTTVAGSARG